MKLGESTNLMHVHVDSGEYFEDCGRPLGIRCADDGESLVVADAKLGLYRVDLRAGHVGAMSYMLHANQTVDGKPLGFLNMPAILPNGRILVSQSDYTHPFDLSIYSVMEHKPNGKYWAHFILRYFSFSLYDKIGFS